MTVDARVYVSAFCIGREEPARWLYNRDAPGSVRKKFPLWDVTGSGGA